MSHYQIRIESQGSINDNLKEGVFKMIKVWLLFFEWHRVKWEAIGFLWNQSTKKLHHDSIQA
jgi:hypothetical protein